MKKIERFGMYQKRLREWLKHTEELPAPRAIWAAMGCSLGTAYRLHRWAIRNLTA